jgi:phosphoglycerol transferase MdoB-like AlkP superfamily enzyme
VSSQWAWRTTVARSAPTLRSTFLLALGCNAALEASRLVSVEGALWRFKTPWFPALFLVGTLVVWSMVGLVHAVTGRMWLTRTILVAVTIVVAVADHQKVRVREEPLYPSDVAFVTQLRLLAEMVGLTWLLVAAGVVTAAVVASVLVLRSRRGRRTPSEPSRTDRGPGNPVPGVRVVAGALCLLALVHAAHFNQPGNLVRAAFDVAGAEWRPWSQQRNYLGNGFVAGVLYNTDVPPMAAPAGYGPATMAEIVRRYAAHARRINQERTAEGLDGVNVVMVLSESLSDPTVLRGVTTGQDPIPFTRRLMRSTTSGSLLAPGIGGGTANAEFEVLTGMSLALFPPQLRVPFQMLVPERSRFPSLVQWYETTGHRPIAVHPFSTEMYRRRDVYRAFGFDAFVHEETLSAPRRLGHEGYVSDASAFDEVVTRLRGSERPLFVQLVTMQNHIPYEERYDHPIPVRGPDGGPLPPTGQYLRGLWHSDRALQSLVQDLQRLPERTVLVVYGDHLPGTYPEPVRELNGWLTMHRTPFVVWSTFPGIAVSAPLVSPAHLTDLVLEHTDAPVTPYTALLTRLREELPALSGRVGYDAAGRPVPLAHLAPDALRLLRDYRMVQYDLAVGRGWSEAGMLSDLAGPPTR